MTDEELAKMAGKGDAVALDTLARRHRREMRVWALLELGEPASADDATQDALIRLVRFIGQFDPTRPFRPWLRSLVRTAASDHRRKGLRAVRTPPTPEPPPSVERNIDIQRGASRAMNAFAGLSIRQREALWLCERKGLTPTEASMEMGVEPATVRALLHQGRRAVRTALLESAPDLVEVVRQA